MLYTEQEYQSTPSMVADQSQGLSINTAIVAECSLLTKTFPKIPRLEGMFWYTRGHSFTVESQDRSLA